MLAKWFHSVNGYAKYLIGPHVSAETALERARICAECPNLRVYAMEDFKGWNRIIRWLYRAPVMGWCGEPGKQTDTTCGCPVVAEDVPATLTVKGQPMVPAGKVECAGESCPSGRW